MNELEQVKLFWSWIDKRFLESQYEYFVDLERTAGFSKGAIGSRKNQNKLPTTDMALGLCKALNVSWGELWGHAGIAGTVNLDKLDGLDAEIAKELGTLKDLEFKNTLLALIRQYKANKK